MRKSDWLDVGLKILGAYFVIVGVREVLRAFVVLAVADSRAVRDLGLGWALLFPLVEVAAGLKTHKPRRTWSISPRVMDQPAKLNARMSRFGKRNPERRQIP